jgi:predicted RNA-binding protein with RPS1 domain
MLNIGDIVTVKVKGIEQGKISLTMRACQKMKNIGKEKGGKMTGEFQSSRPRPSLEGARGL